MSSHTSWWDIANDGNESTGRRLAAGIGCGLLPWVCLGQEGAAAAGEATDAAGNRVRTAVMGEAGEGGILEGLGGLAESTGGAIAEPLNAIGEIMKWYAIGLGVAILAVLLGLFIWFVALPLMNLGGPRRAAA